VAVLIKDISVGDNLDNRGTLFVIRAITAFSGGGNGEIQFEEHWRGHMCKREMTWKQFERLRFIRKVAKTVKAQPEQKPPDTAFVTKYPAEGTTHSWKVVCRCCGIERREKFNRLGFSWHEYLVDGKWTQKRPPCAKGT
jgi:hypothetical protein